MSPSPATPPTASGEWRDHWPLIAAAMTGLSLGAIPSSTLGLFMDPLQGEFGWSRTQVTLGLTVLAAVSLPLTPFAGVLVDKFGPRRVAIPGVALSALSFAAFSLLGGSLVQWLGIWLVFSLVSLLTRTFVWNSAVSAVFKASRGLAIAALLAGAAGAQSLSPLAAHWLIENFGWRAAYLGFGLGWGGITFLLVVLLFRLPGTAVPQAQSHASVSVLGGLTVRQAFRNPAIHRIALATFLQFTVGLGVMVHLMPMLTNLGISRGEAASIAAIFGVSSIAGNFVCGWLVDKFDSNLVLAIIFSAPILSYLLLWIGSDSRVILSAGVFVLGCSVGGALQLNMFLTTRYAGLCNIGTIYAGISSIMAFAAGLGPLLAAAIFDAMGNYELLLFAAMPVSILAGLAVYRLGPYPDFK